MKTYLSAISQEKSRVEQELRSRDIRLFKSAGNFACVSLPTLEQAQDITAALQKTGIFIKGQKGRSDEGVLRITIGRPEDNNRMLAEISKLLQLFTTKPAF